jgi:hypothetical protein
LSASEYQNFKTPALHWYCPSCEEKVMKNLRTDREVEKRCSEFMQKMEDRIKTLEIKIESQVNSEEVVEIVKRIVDVTILLWSLRLRSYSSIFWWHFEERVNNQNGGHK